MPATTLLDIPPARASPDARCAAPSALWLPPGVARVTAVCRWPHSDGDCRRLVLLALQCLPHRPPLSRWPAGLHRRRRRPTGRPRPDDRLAALVQALVGRAAQGPTPGLWLVSHALELRHVGGPTHRPNMALRSPRGPYGAGSMNWVGCGNGPSWSPKMTIPSGSNAWQSPVMIRHSSTVRTTRNRTLPLCICS